MKKLKVITIILICLLVFSGCFYTRQGDVSRLLENKEDFEVVSKQRLANITDDGADEFFILKHKETGKRFILFKGYQKGGITPLD